jgi:hypothetical protein
MGRFGLGIILAGARLNKETELSWMIRTKLAGPRRWVTVPYSGVRVENRGLDFLKREYGRC